MYQILAADDEPMMRKGLQALVDWNALGCNLRGVLADGQALLDEIDKESPDIVLCDIKMPRKSGIDVARSIYERRLPIQVILLTAYADFAYARQAIQYGVSDYVTKTGAVEGIAEAVRKCIRKIEESRLSLAPPTEKEQVAYLKAVLDGSLYERESIEERGALLGLELSQFILLDIELDVGPDTDDTDAVRQTEKLRDMFTTVTEGIPCYLIPLGRCHLCAILPGTYSPGLERSLLELADAFRNLTGVPVYLGVSGQGHGPLALPVCLEQGEAALDQRFFFRGQALHHWRPEPSTPTRPDTAGCLDRIGNAVCTGNLPSALEIMSSLFTLQKEIGLTPKAVRAEGLLLLNLYRKHLAQAGGELQTGRDLEEAILRSRYFEAYQEVLCRATETFCQEITGLLKFAPGIVEAASQYIAENFRRTITLSEVASAVKVNPSYLSRVFKEKTGKSLIDTINGRKIELAKELLSNGQRKIYEVAAAVGISDTTYFSHLFRKYTGVSPKAFQVR